MDAHSTIGLLVKAATCWIMWIIGTLRAACGWDRDSRYSASITELHQRANTPQFVEVDLEKASSITGISPAESSQSRETTPSKSDNSKRPGTGLSSKQITEGLNNQQRAFGGPVDPAHIQYRQVPRTLDDMMLSEILSTCLNETPTDETPTYERTADILSYRMIRSFPKPLRDFLSVLYRRTREQKVQDIIYTPAFSELMHDRSNASRVQTIIQEILKDLQGHIKEKGVHSALLWKPCPLVNVTDL